MGEAKTEFTSEEIHEYISGPDEGRGAGRKYIPRAEKQIRNKNPLLEKREYIEDESMKFPNTSR